MRGEIADSRDSLRRRVALLAGVPVAALEKVWSDKLRLNPGVAAFVEACQAAGPEDVAGLRWLHLLQRTHPPSAQARFRARQHAGRGQRRLTGHAVRPALGRHIVDGTEKKRVLLEVAELMGIDMAQTIAVGDGANDLPMMGAAGLSIAFTPKPAVRRAGHDPDRRRAAAWTARSKCCSAEAAAAAQLPGRSTSSLCGGATAMGW